MSAYKEFTGKTVEEALREAREEFGVGLDGLDFEILTAGSRGVLGMGAEPARIVAAPRSALGGAAPKREAAAAQPLPPRPPRPEGGFGDRDHDRDRGRGFGRGDRDRGRPGGYGGDRGRGTPMEAAAPGGAAGRPDAVRTPDGRAEPRPAREDRPERTPNADRRPERGPARRDDVRGRGPRRERPVSRPDDLTPVGGADEAALNNQRASLAAERAELQAAEASPEALAAGKAILEQLMTHLGFTINVQVMAGETSRLNVVAEGDERESLGALIGRKGERLSALQHIVNLMLSKQMGEWTRVLVDVEDYRGRRERQLRELAIRAAERVGDTGKMLQLEPMPALERRWVHLSLRDHPAVTTQSIGEEPNRRVVVLPRNL
ncbi:MAG TPA: RNA-binding cell elongation regulator Jag/EloR [Candidatus Limnocylindrales bacterium]|nr:RNA-binding cell elongation regulator Jag/EloR [Candidatus Limnocylindrales bacterium]